MASRHSVIVQQIAERQSIPELALLRHSFSVPSVPSVVKIAVQLRGVGTLSGTLSAKRYSFSPSRISP